jgi:aminoglycoside phosphotransferase (APT) family kinase protein
MGRGHGVIGSLYRINLEYDVDAPDAPCSLIAKLPARIGPIRDLAARFNMYEREARFYEQLAPELSLPTPRLYYSATSDDGGLTLLLEDMSPARAGDLMAGTTLDQMQKLVRTVAELHGEWWNSPKLSTFAWLPSLNDPVALEIGSSFAGEAWDTFVNNFGEHLPPPVQRLGSILRGDRSVLDRLSTRPRTLVHGDLRINNLMFREGGSLSAVLDWQSTVAARGPVDVARLFVNNLGTEDRRTAEAELLLSTTPARELGVGL